MIKHAQSTRHGETDRIVAVRAADKRCASSAVGRRIMTVAALLASITSLGLHFLPTLANSFEYPEIVQPWLVRLEAAMIGKPMRGSAQSGDLDGLSSSLEAIDALPGDEQKAFRLAAEFATISNRIEALKSDVRTLQLQQKKSSSALDRSASSVALIEKRLAAQDLELIGLRGSLDEKIESAAVRVNQIEARLASTPTHDDVNRIAKEIEASINELKGEVAHNRGAKQQLNAIEQRIADLEHSISGRDDIRLLLSRLSSMTVSGPVGSRELELLAQLTREDANSARLVAELKILAGQGGQPVYVLRDRFRELRPRALEIARTEGLSSIDSIVASARHTLSSWGMSAERDRAIGELAIMNASEALDNGDLSKALFELEALSPQTRRFLGVWIGQAKLRLSMDAVLSSLTGYLSAHPAKITPKS